MSDHTDAVTLRQWADDAATAFANWPTMSQAQKDTTMRTVVQRLGIVAAHMADIHDHNTFSD